MGYSAEIFEKAQEILGQRRDDAQTAQDARMDLLEKTDPEYKECRSIMIGSVRDLLSTLDDEPAKMQERLSEIQRINLETQEKIRQILIRNNLPESYLDYKYFCPDCQDTGSVGTKMCHCMVDILKKLTIDAEGRKSPLKFSRFEDFKLDYYSDEKSAELGGESPRKRMEGILAFCKEYAATFDTDSQSIFMYGETGLGKSHLSLAIAAEVIGKGYTVIYNSAQNILTKLSNIQFGKVDDLTYEPMLLECDLLVIDDLGAEFRTQFTQAAVYNIINTRMNSGLPTIISTNITLEELADIYTQRIASRIIGEYEVIRFVGDDIRQIKKQ